MAERASANSRARAARAAPEEARRKEEGGFQVRLWMLPGLTPMQEMSFEQGLASYLQAHDLQADGTQLQMRICASHPLAVVDWVDLMAWLMLSTPVASVHIARTPSPVKQGQVALRASRSDLALGPLLSLYRLGRLRAEVVAEVLGS